MSTHHPQKKGMRTFLFRLFIMATLLALSVAAITLGALSEFQDTALDLPVEGLIYNLPAGASLNQLAYDLEARGVRPVSPFPDPAWPSNGSGKALAGR